MSQHELLKVTDDDNGSTSGDFYVKYKRIPNAADAPAQPTRRYPCSRSGPCCPLWCYGRKCVIFGIVLSVLATAVSIILLVDFAVTTLHPHVHVVNFVHGTCVVESGTYMQYPGKCRCGQSGGACRTYPCLEVIVRYSTDKGETHHTVLYATDDEYTYTSHCSITPHCESGSDNLAEVEQFRIEYGQKNQSFACFHHPTGYGAVVKRLHPPVGILHVLLWPILAVILSLVSCLFVFCHCVPRFCNKDF